MARATPRLELNVWDLTSDPFNHVELAENWDLIDAQIFVAKGFEIVSTLPTSGLFPGRIVILSTPSGGFRAWTLMRYDGVSWAPIGSVEIHPTIPSTGYEGRIIILSGSDGGFPAWTMLRYAGSSWRPFSDLSAQNEGIDVGAGSKINFVAGNLISITAEDDEANDTIDITVDTDVAAATVQKNGVTIGKRETINLIEGDNVTLTVTSEASEINITPNIAAPSAPPGTGIIAQARYVEQDTAWYYRPANPTSSLSGDTWVEYDTTNLAVTFTVPDSGRVLLVWAGMFLGPWNSKQPRWGMTTGGGSVVASTSIGVSYHVPAGSPAVPGDYPTNKMESGYVQARKLITGLTPEDELTWYWAGNGAALGFGIAYGQASVTVFQVD